MHSLELEANKELGLSRWNLDRVRPLCDTLASTGLMEPFEDLHSSSSSLVSLAGWLMLSKHSSNHSARRIQQCGSQLMNEG